jgi:DNA-binding transcriptional LysR family regulator
VELRHLRYALALAEHQHFGRAAAAVGIAQPPLSKQITALEREVGTALFDRTPRGVYPTAAGEAFLARARRSLEEAAAATADARRAARGETGRLRIGFMASALLEFLPAVLRHFHANHPEVQLHLEEMSSARSGRAVIEGTCDVSLTRGAPRGAGAEHLSSVPLGRDRLVAVVSSAHPFAGQATITIGQLEGQPLIMSPPDQEPATTAALAPLVGHGFEPVPHIPARAMGTIISLAAAGIGIGLGPSSMRAVARPDVWICEVSPPTELPELSLSWRTQDRSPVLRAFLGSAGTVWPRLQDALHQRGISADSAG